jgi:hypothetical protein
VIGDDDPGHGTGVDYPAGTFGPVNPYIAGAPVSGERMFYGRDDVFAFIQRKLIGRHRDTPIVLMGERRTGKTSVLYQVSRHLDRSYRCVTIDMHGLNLNGIGGLLYGIAGSVSNGLRSDYGFNIAFPDRRAFEAEPRSAFESGFLPAVLAALDRDHLVLMLDEVARLDEEIRAGHLDREVFSYLRHLMQHHPRLNFIFSLGSGLEEMQKDYAFMFGAAMYHRISFLEEAAARKLITAPVRGCFQVSPDAVDAILRVTSGHPYYTQLVCHGLFDRWASDRPRRRVMTAEDVHAATDEATELGSPNLTYVWEDSSDGEKAVMAAMAAAMRAEPRAVTGKAIRSAWRKANGHLPERELSAALRSLANREVITGTDAYSFTVDLQRRWLDRHRRPDGLKDELAGSIRQWNQAARAPRNRILAGALTAVACLGAASLTAAYLNSSSATNGTGKPSPPATGSLASSPTASVSASASTSPSQAATPISPPKTSSPPPPSAASSATATSQVPPPPTNLSVTSDANDAINVSWSAPAPGLLYYVVHFEDLSSQAPAWQAMPSTTGTTAQLPSQVDGHTVSVKVSVALTANAASDGPAIGTAPYVSPPLDFEATSPGSGAVRMTWTAIPGDTLRVYFRMTPNGPVTCGISPFQCSFPYQGNSTDGSYQFGGLPPGDEYAIYATVTNQFGTSGKSAIISLQISQQG